MRTLLKLSFLGAIASAIGACASPAAIECDTGVLCPSGTQCAAAQPVCITNNCGNAITDPGELCDDGNIIDGDGCSADCKSTEQCGDGVINSAAGEICDDGNTVGGDGCSPDCKPEGCGNGRIDTYIENGMPKQEACDDGNTTDGDGCNKTCTSTEVCGNGIIDDEVGEICDPPNGTTCSPDCRSGLGCGNGIIDPGEECDDGGANNADDKDCRHDCVINRCGDGYTNANGTHVEQCDGAAPVAEHDRTATPTETAGCNADCTANSCGDHKINRTAGEQCDDGTGVNADNADCTAGCLLNVCGDGHADTAGVNPDQAEECDDANAVETDGCSNACTTPHCGNGIVDMGEQCDLGTLNSLTGACLPVTCVIATCGDGHTYAGVEQCDDGNHVNGDTCSATCRSETCGNGIIDPGEACDDNNQVNGDGCSSTCHFERCGDGIVNNGEFCDGNGLGVGGETALCNADCTMRSCGDGKVNKTAGEQCDAGTGNNGDTKDCTAGCKLNVCGDGKVDMVAGAHFEQCDDGNLINTDGCTNSCTTQSCGNGITDMGEQCDDGNSILTDACQNCMNAFCGDGKVRAGFEACDDGNTTNGDGCDNNCTVTMCGNGVKTAGEQCDDGNLVSGDGCSATCKLERCGNGIVDPGETCDGNGLGVGGETALCNRDCTGFALHDGKVNATAGEECDDMNSINTDDCLATDKLNRCGDGFRDATLGAHFEACDDGNTVNNDGCSNACSLPTCGNGILDQGEQCDDGNLVNTDNCTALCQIATCGDGIINLAAGEQCDDGINNGANKDCLPTCKTNVCGDGFRDTTAGLHFEVCDDGNTMTESVCPYGQVTCQTCRNDCGQVQSHTGSYCGDGVTDTASGEVCDDGDRVTNTSCPYGMATCTLCKNDCSGPTAVLTGSYCGDGIADAGEVCDDHNTLACGACNATCSVVTSSAATGFIFLPAGSDLAEGDQFQISDGISAMPWTFKFTNMTVTGSRITGIAFAAGDTQAQVRTAVVTAINSVTTGLLVTAQASATPGVVNLTHDYKTSLGNIMSTESVATANFAIIGMFGGAGGFCGSGTACTTNDDCASHVCAGTGNNKMCN